MGNEKKFTHSVLTGATILTVSGFISKVLAALYRVPYQNFVGDAGFYVYQQVYPIYGIAMMIALGGLPMFVSKIVVETKDEEELETALNRCFFYLSILSMALFLFVFFGSGLLAGWMGQEKLEPVIRMSAASFLLTPFLAILRGGFQGKLFMTPTAISQVVEQFFRVGIICFAAFCFVNFHTSIYETGVYAMSGSIVGGVIAVVILLYYLKTTRLLPLTFHKRKHGLKKGHHIFKRMLLEGGVMSLFSGYLILLQLVDSFTVKKALVDYGLSNTSAEVTKGIFDRGQPLVQLGLIVSLGLTSSFLPALTKDYLTRNKESFEKNSKLLLKLSFTLGSAATLGLILLLPAMNRALFKDNQQQLALSIFLVSVFLMGYVQAMQSLLQSKGNYWTPLKSALCGLVVKVLLSYLMTEIMGPTGASLSTILALITACGVLLFSTKTYWLSFAFVCKNVLGLLLMTAALVIFLSVAPRFEERWMAFLIAIVGVLIGGGVFLATVGITKAFEVKEIEKLPFVSKFIRKRS